MSAVRFPNLSQAQQAIADLARAHGLMAVPMAAPDVRFDATGGMYSDLHLRTAKAWLRAAQIRRDALGGQFGADPAWDILLTLYVARRETKPVSATAACAASGAPVTTGLRWIKLLVQRGLIERSDDNTDARRVNLRLDPAGVSLIEAALDAVIDSDRRCGVQRLSLIEDIDRAL